jgi:hypothetical protein
VCTQLIKVCAAISLRAGSLSAAGPCISPVANGRPGRRVDYKKPQPHTPSSAKVKWATFLQSGALIDLVRCESELRPFKTAEEQPSHATLPACIQIDKKIDRQGRSGHKVWWSSCSSALAAHASALSRPARAAKTRLRQATSRVLLENCKGIEENLGDVASFGLPSLLVNWSIPC